MNHTRDGKRQRVTRIVLALTALGLGPGIVPVRAQDDPANGLAAPTAARPTSTWSKEALTLAGGYVAWETDLPLRYTARIRDYALVEGYLLATGTDGIVRAFRADTGVPVWTRRVAREMESFWGPIATRIDTAMLPVESRSPGNTAPAEPTAPPPSNGKVPANGEVPAEAETLASPPPTPAGMIDAVVFTRVDSVVMLNLHTGEMLKELPVAQPNTAMAAVSDRFVVQISIEKRVRCLRIKDGVEQWLMATPGFVRLMPTYLREPAGALIVDDTATVALVDVDPKGKIYAAELKTDKPVGYAISRDVLLVTTADRMLFVLDRATGELRWKRFLRNWPRGAAVGIGEAIYQPTAEAGLICLNRKDGSVNWVDPRGEQVLAHWNDHAVVLRKDDTLAFWNIARRAPTRLIALDHPCDGLANPLNRAAFLTTADGRMRCLQPIRGTTVSQRDFRTLPGEPTIPGRTTTATADATAAPAKGTGGDQQDLDLKDPLRSNLDLQP